MNAATEAARWRAVCNRDGAGQEAFVFAVRTTGVYCRPGCAARRPRRENVVFYDAPGEAEAAGYRPCRRCRPHQAAALPHADAIARACRLLQEAAEEPSLPRLAQDAGLSPGHFQRLFKQQVGLSPKQYARAARQQRLRDGLGSAGSVTEAIYAAGYASASRAYADKKSASLSLYRRGAKGEAIFYATAATGLGEILVAMTERGICLVEFLDEREVEAALRQRFAQARLQPAGKRQAALVKAIVAEVNGATAGSGGGLPLDVRGTAFQEKVWRALMDIPAGETRSYGRLAEAVGSPKAARAVGAACGVNPVSVLIPCHRAVGANGALTGYRWGVQRKQKLLQREARQREANAAKRKRGAKT